MSLIEFLSSPWAIDPGKLLELQGIYATHLRGDKIDVAAIEARLGRPLAAEQQDYALQQGGVALLAVDGVIAPKANLMTQVSGGVSAQMMLKQVNSMHADPRVKSAVLAMDTPGGNVLGIPMVADAIRAMAADKPVVTVSTGTIASAGYWWGSAANAIYISGGTDHIGSIGVVATHSYQPRATGTQTTEITAGRYKRMASGSAPLSAEGQAYLQSQVDEIYRVFVDTVAQNRGVSADQVVQHMADGRIFIGQQALDAGLVDGVSTVDAMVERLATNPAEFAQRRKAVFAVSRAAPAPARKPARADAAAAATVSTTAPPTTTAEVPMTQASTAPGDITTADALAAAHPELVEQIRASAHATGHAAGHTAGLQAGAQAERDRIAAVRAQALPGHEALVEQLAMDGKTTGPEAAMALVAAHRAALSSQATNHFADGATAAPASHHQADGSADNKPRRHIDASKVYGSLNHRAAA